MPILDIEVVLLGDEAVNSNWAVEIADAVGEIFDSPPGRTWVRIRDLPRSQYAENDTGDSLELCPVFVSVLKAQLPEVEDLRVEVEKLTTSIARITGRPMENVHVLYLPQGAGRVSFGGKLLSRHSDGSEEDGR